MAEGTGERQEGWVSQEIDCIHRELRDMERDVDEVVTQTEANNVLLQKVYAMQFKMNTKLDKVLGYLTPPPLRPAVAFAVKVQVAPPPIQPLP